MSCLGCCHGDSPSSDRQSSRGQPSSWLILIAVFSAHLLTCGISYRLGVYYLPVLETFEKSNGITSWVGSLNAAVLCVTGKRHTSHTARLRHDETLADQLLQRIQGKSTFPSQLTKVCVEIATLNIKFCFSYICLARLHGL